MGEEEIPWSDHRETSPSRLEANHKISEKFVGLKKKDKISKKQDLQSNLSWLICYS